MKRLAILLPLLALAALAAAPVRAEDPATGEPFIPVVPAPDGLADATALTPDIAKHYSETKVEPGCRLVKLFMPFHSSPESDTGSRTRISLMTFPHGMSDSVRSDDELDKTVSELEAIPVQSFVMDPDQDLDAPVHSDVLGNSLIAELRGPHYAGALYLRHLLERSHDRIRSLIFGVCHIHLAGHPYWVQFEVRDPLYRDVAEIGSYASRWLEMVAAENEPGSTPAPRLSKEWVKPRLDEWSCVPATNGTICCHSEIYAGSRSCDLTVMFQKTTPEDEARFEKQNSESLSYFGTGFESTSNGMVFGSAKSIRLGNSYPGICADATGRMKVDESGLGCVFASRGWIVRSRPGEKALILASVKDFGSEKAPSADLEVFAPLVEQTALRILGNRASADKIAQPPATNSPATHAESTEDAKERAP